MSTYFDLESNNDQLINYSSLGDEKTVQRLIDDGAYVNNKTYDSTTALHSACLNGHYLCTQILLKAGANVNAADVDGGTPLCAAACKGDVQCIQLLLLYGALINPPFTATSPLHETAMTGHAEAMQFLIRSGANLNTNDLHFGSPLHICSDHGHTKCAFLLLRAGADVNNAKSHVIPLHVASTKNRVGVAQLLLDFGGNLYARNNWGHTPLMLSPKGSDIQRLLLEHQGTPFSLRHFCRLSIRRCLGQQRLDFIPRLTLPSLLLKYIDHDLNLEYSDNII